MTAFNAELAGNPEGQSIPASARQLTLASMGKQALVVSLWKVADSSWLDGGECSCSLEDASFSLRRVHLTSTTPLPPPTPPLPPPLPSPPPPPMLLKSEMLAWKDLFESTRGPRTLIPSSRNKLVDYFTAKGTTLREVDTTPPEAEAPLASWLDEWKDYAAAAGISDLADAKNVVRFMSASSAVTDTLTTAGSTSKLSKPVVDDTPNLWFWPKQPPPPPPPPPSLPPPPPPPPLSLSVPPPTSENIDKVHTRRPGDDDTEERTTDGNSARDEAHGAAVQLGEQQLTTSNTSIRPIVGSDEDITPGDMQLFLFVAVAGTGLALWDRSTRGDAETNLTKEKVSRVLQPLWLHLAAVGEGLAVWMRSKQHRTAEESAGEKLDRTINLGGSGPHGNDTAECDAKAIGKKHEKKTTLGTASEKGKKALIAVRKLGEKLSEELGETVAVARGGRRRDGARLIRTHEESDEDEDAKREELLEEGVAEVADGKEVQYGVQEEGRQQRRAGGAADPSNATLAVDKEERWRGRRRPVESSAVSDKYKKEEPLLQEKEQHQVQEKERRQRRATVDTSLVAAEEERWRHDGTQLVKTIGGGDKDDKEGALLSKQTKQGGCQEELRRPSRAAVVARSNASAARGVVLANSLD